MPKLTSVKKSVKLSDQAYEIIKEAIIKNQLKPGDILAEEKLAEQLQISRTPIKAALNRLVYEEIAAVNTSKNIVVANITAEDVRNVTQVRRCLEELAVLLLENKLTKQQLHDLKRIDRSQKEAIEKSNLEKYVDMDYQFHVRIAQFGGNPFLMEMAERVNLVTKRYLILSGTLSKYSGVAWQEHEQIIDALEHGDFQAAAKSMTEHLTNVDHRMLVL